MMNSVKKVFHLLRRKLAKLWLEVNLQLTIIGVTGSYGKTSAVRTIAEVLSAKCSVNKTDTNLDTIFNLPITILKTKIWDEVLVLEYGIDHPDEMSQHLSLVRPKIAVLTGITPVHSDSEHLGSIENIIKEKTKLIFSLPEDGLAIFNYDDLTVRKVGNNFSGRKIFYGFGRKADVWSDKIQIDVNGTSFILHDGKKEMKVKTKLIGYPGVYSCLIAYVVGKELKVDESKILEKLAKIDPLPGRLNIENGPLGTILLNDALRANPASTIAGLKTLSAFSGRKIAVLGEMGELGKSSEEMHRLVGEEVFKNKVDFLVGVGPLLKFTVDSAVTKGLDKNKTFHAKSINEAAEILKGIIQAGDILYLKASLLRHLERILLLLKGQNVTCEEVVCHNYQPCSSCTKLAKPLK